MPNRESGRSLLVLKFIVKPVTLPSYQWLLIGCSMINEIKLEKKIISTKEAYSFPYRKK